MRGQGARLTGGLGLAVLLALVLILVPAGTAFVAGPQIAAGYDHTCAVLSTDHIDRSGDNDYGQLGDGTTSSTDTPVEVQSITNATHVAAGGYQTCAVLSTGHIDCWGENGYARHVLAAAAPCCATHGRGSHRREP